MRKRTMPQIGRTHTTIADTTAASTTATMIPLTVNRTRGSLMAGDSKGLKR